MADQLSERHIITKTIGMALGIGFSPLIGPLLFHRFGLGDAVATAVGCLLGLLCGYAFASAYLWAREGHLDKEIQQAILSVIAEAGLSRSIKVKVRKASVSLDGEVEDDEQRRRAEQLVRALPGVRGVSNRIRARFVQPVDTGTLKNEIEQALRRAADREAQGIRVKVNDSRVVLEGQVSSWIEASEAEDLAWAIPGVREVDNRLEILH